MGNLIEQSNFDFDVEKALQHTHEGSIGNLCNEAIRQEMDQALEKIPPILQGV